MRKPTVSNASTEAEQAVLGGLMLSNDSWLAVADVVTAEHFSRPDHRLIFSAIATLATERKPFDPVTVSEILDRQKSLRDVGGIQYLGTLTKQTPGAANVRVYANYVFDRWKMRRAGDIAGELLQASNNGDDAADVAIAKLMELTHTAKTNDGRLGDALGNYLDELDARYRNERPKGVMSGLSRLDAKLGGFGNSHLIVLAGRPSMGKTALALNMINANPGVPVGIMSSEQPREELVGRLMSIDSGVDAHAMRLGTITEADWPRLTTSAKAMRDRPIYVNDKASPHIEEIARQARKWKHYHGIEYLIIDYIQRLKGPGRERHSQVEEIARGCKEVARDMNIPVIALCQVSRDVEKRDDKRPQMSDLRDSGAIEQEADLILTIYRDEVYYGATPGREGEVEIATLKNRHGPRGVVTCKFDGTCLRFEDYEFGQRGDPGPGATDDLPFDSPPRGNGAHERSMENRRGPYRRSSTGG